MAAAVVLSTSKVNPLSPASAMRRAAGQNEALAKVALFEMQFRGVRMAATAELIAKQTELPANQAVSVFPQLALMLMQQSTPQRVIPRLQLYEEMAASNDDHADVGIGQLFDMHA